MRRFLQHVPPGAFSRIRHYGLLPNGTRRLSPAAARQLLGVQVAVCAAVARKPRRTTSLTRNRLQKSESDSGSMQSECCVAAGSMEGRGPSMRAPD
jgi:hypothetical protein